MSVQGLFRRHSGISCFFCQSPINPIPRDPSSFHCPHCSCWNRYNASGEIISDEPAMHDEALNSRSFAKRASPSKNRLPTMYGKGPFCHQCQTNQMLLMNLLSNYLPSTDNPEYTKRLGMLPEYKDSLHLRYPPVCASCLPAVEEEIKLKDTMARTKALGGWLKESKGKGKQRQVSGAEKEREKLGIQILAWKVRGGLWVSSLTSTILGYSTAAFGYRLPPRLALLQPALPAIALVSILWTAWDPTYLSFRKSQLQGRDVRVTGKNKYVMLQMVAWLSRLLTSILVTLAWFRPHADYLHLSDGAKSSRSRSYFSVSLFIELFTFITSCIVLRLQQPPSIRLIDTTTHLPSDPIPSIARNGASPMPNQPLSEPDLLSALSLSSKPVIMSNPVFGLPSLLTAVPSSSSSAPHKDEDRMDEDADVDAMDWTPTHPSPSPNKGKQKVLLANDDGSWLRPQRFFAPELPTGLEGLFERTKLVDDTDRSENHAGRRVVAAHAWNWWWMYVLSLVPLAGIVYKAWGGRDSDFGITAPTTMNTG